MIRIYIIETLGHHCCLAEDLILFIAGALKIYSIVHALVVFFTSFEISGKLTEGRRLFCSLEMF